MIELHLPVIDTVLPVASTTTSPPEQDSDTLTTVPVTVLLDPAGTAAAEGSATGISTGALNRLPACPVPLLEDVWVESLCRIVTSGFAESEADAGWVADDEAPDGAPPAPHPVMVIGATTPASNTVENTKLLRLRGIPVMACYLSEIRGRVRPGRGTTISAGAMNVMGEKVLSADLPTSPDGPVSNNSCMQTQRERVRQAALHASSRNTELSVYGIVILRLAQLLLWPIGLLFGVGAGIQLWPLAISAGGVLTLWSLIWVTIALSRKALPGWSLWTDVGMSAAAAAAVGLACYPWDALSWSNFAVALTLGSMFSVSLLFPFRSLAIAWLVLALGLALGASAGFAQRAAVLPNYLSTLATLLVLAAVGFLASHRLRTLAALAQASAEALDEEMRWRNEQERQGAERTKQYRTLHDTVLSTLSALARGSLDAADPQVQRRCAADAEYLRSIISSASRSATNRLQGELATLGREQAVLGIRVHHQVADLPATLPDEVVTAIRDASREALNNVAKHSGETQAWITGRGDPGDSDAVTVTVTDRGRGFDSTMAAAGLGLRDSIAARMVEVGGSATIDSQPGQGTSVELRWPA